MEVKKYTKMVRNAVLGAMALAATTNADGTSLAAEQLSKKAQSALLNVVHNASVLKVHTNVTRNFAFLAATQARLCPKEASAFELEAKLTVKRIPPRKFKNIPYGVWVLQHYKSLYQTYDYVNRTDIKVWQHRIQDKTDNNITIRMRCLDNKNKIAKFNTEDLENYNIQRVMTRLMIINALEHYAMFDIKRRPVARKNLMDIRAVARVTWDNDVENFAPTTHAIILADRNDIKNIKDLIQKLKAELRKPSKPTDVSESNKLKYTATYYNTDIALGNWGKAASAASMMQSLDDIPANFAGVSLNPKPKKMKVKK